MCVCVRVGGVSVLLLDDGVWLCFGGETYIALDLFGSIRYFMAPRFVEPLGNIV